MTDVNWANPGDAAAVAAHIAEVVARPGAKRLAFTGGSTPLKVFALLAAQKLDWCGVTIALTDDRCVPDDHPASNFGKMHAALGDCGASFERLEEGMVVAPFDLVWLGMGEDGHIASLFPDLATTAHSTKSAVAVDNSPKPPAERVSISVDRLALASAIYIFALGEGKHDALTTFIQKQSGPVALVQEAATFGQMVIATDLKI